MIDKESKEIEGKMKSLYAGVVERMGVSCKASLDFGPYKYLVTYNPVY